MKFVRACGTSSNCGVLSPHRTRRSGGYRRKKEKCEGDEDAECGKKNSERQSCATRREATRSGAERSGARKAVARGRKARGGKGRRPRGRRRLTDRRRSRGERARLRGIPGRARAVPPEARRFQSFARDDEPRTSRVRETRSRFTVRPTDPHRVYRASIQRGAQTRGKRKGGGEGWPDSTQADRFVTLVRATLGVFFGSNKEKFFIGTPSDRSRVHGGVG